MNRLLVTLFLIFSCECALAQGAGTIPAGSVAIGQGPGKTGFAGVAPGASGTVLMSNGAGVNPSFQNISGATLADGSVTNAKLSPGAANTFKGSLNGTATSDIPLTACTLAYQITKWVAGTGWQCGLIPVLPSRAVAASLDLSAFSSVQTLGYATGGDGGAGIFTKTTSPFVDNYITGVSLTTAGSGCANGTYRGVGATNVSGSLAGHGALFLITVSGNIVTGLTTTTVGNQFAVSDVLTPDTTTTSLTCTVLPTFTVTSVAVPTCSFTDAASNKWQLVVSGPLNVKQCGAKADYYRPNGDSGSTDDTQAIQNALYFAANILPPTVDAYGEAGTILEIPRGVSLVGQLNIPFGVWFRGQGRYSSGLKMLNSLSNSSNWITVCDSQTQLACFGTQLSDMTLWHNGTPSANAGTTMVYTNNLQQATAFSRLQIVAGSRSCFDLETGYGGAALIGFLDIECGTSTTTNPGMLINYPSAIIPMNGVITEANPSVAQSGIAVTGGFLNVINYHCENYSTCIFMNVAANNGMSRFEQLTGGGSGCTNLLLRQGGSAANVNTAEMLSGICTNKLNNAGATTTTPIVGQVTF